MRQINVKINNSADLEENNPNVNSNKYCRTSKIHEIPSKGTRIIR
jgi:hypothetical protein